ncbi:MAG: DUF4956 domain-containing protein [Lachnospiraceae bacterium]|nr:DUF4956 domain-containing protein [Lachnospiraceae bacterium]MBP3610863.1 DUF4956 domain-containing protein [Lachnospiraceae bacterium]
MICMLVAVVFGLITGSAYFIICKKEQRSLTFFLSLVMIPAVVSVVIVLIGSNVARAFSIAGVFALVRYRSVPGDGKDISFVFMAMAAGLACGLGYLTLGFAVVAVLSAVVVLVNVAGRAVVKSECRQLRILIPEDMDYQGVFDDIFKEYASKVSLERIKTTNMGTLYELTYHIYLKNGINEKKFLDEIRCRNGNLTIILSRQEPLQGL